MRHRRTRQNALLLLAVIGIAVSSATATSPAPDNNDPYLRAVMRADTLLNSGKRPEGYALLERLAAEAKERGDLRLELRARTRLGGRLAWFGEPRRAIAVLREAIPRIEVLGDSALDCEAMAWLGISLGLVASFDAADSVYRKGLPLAAAIGDRASEAKMRHGSAYVYLQTGRSARARDTYREAIRLYQETKDIRGELDSRTGLGRAYTELGDLANAQAEFERIALLARENKLRNNEADALNNLGSTEFLRGDPEAGLEFFRGALRIRRSLGIPYATIIPAYNVAWALTDLGRYREARASLDSLLSVCVENGFRDQEAGVRQALGNVLEKEGSFDDAKRQFRSTLATGEDLRAKRILEAYRGVARCLAGQDSIAEAVAVIRGAGSSLEKSSADDRLAYDLDLVDCLLLSPSDLAEASAVALRADREAEALSRSAERVRALTVAATAELRLRRIESARSLIDRATSLWEEIRARPVDYEWRENYSRGEALCALQIEAILADSARLDHPARVAQAFNAAQRFKARTFLDRAQGPAGLHLASGAGLTGVDLASLQERCLRDGEILLDAYVGGSHSYLFGVTKKMCAVQTLPGAAGLGGRVDILLALVAERPAGTSGGGTDEILATASDSLGALVLQGLRESVLASKIVLFSPDGPLHRVPLEILLGRGSLPIVSRVPCATFLAASIRASQPDGGTKTVIAHGIAIGGGRAPDGRQLSGAVREVRTLATRYRGVTARAIPEGIARRGGGILAEYDLVHIAAHTRLYDDYPWRSGVWLGGSDVPDSARWLRAETIVKDHLRARLVVLSGCESAGGRAIPGEGIQGMTSAFLAAGAPAVVATLWPVDDRVTFDLMMRFYAGLERGLSVGTALQAARREIAARPGTESPFYWAGFILAGDPDIRLVLRRKILGLF